MFLLMTIAECISEAQVKEFVRLFHDETFDLPPGSPEALVLTEHEGNMIVIQFEFSTREKLLTFGQSRSWRQFVSRSQHLLVGNYIRKIFEIRKVLV